MEVKIAKLLSTQGYIQVNKHLIKTVGLDTAVFIGEICAEYNFYDTNNKLEEDGSFFSTIENIENNTGLKRKRQEACIVQLTELGILSIKLKGLPCKRYFYINFEKLLCLFKTNKSVQKIQANMSVEDKQDESKSASNKHNIININNKNKEINNVVVDVVNDARENSDVSFEDPEKDIVIDALERYLQQPISNVLLDTINEFDISDDLKIYAIKNWVGSKKDYREPSVNYLKGILRNIKQSGATTVEEFEKQRTENNKSNSDKWLEVKQKENELKAKELDLKEKNQPYYQKQIEMQSGKVEQTQQKKEDQDKSMALFTQYYDDYIKGNISKEKLQELGMDESLFFQLDSDKANYQDKIEMQRLKAEYEKKWGKKE